MVLTTLKSSHWQGPVPFWRRQGRTHFFAHLSCQQNSVPCVCRTENPVSLLAVSWEPYLARRQRPLTSLGLELHLPPLKPAMAAGIHLSLNFSNLLFCPTLSLFVNVKDSCDQFLDPKQVTTDNLHLTVFHFDHICKATFAMKGNIPTGSGGQAVDFQGRGHYSAYPSYNEFFNI